MAFHNDLLKHTVCCFYGPEVYGIQFCLPKLRACIYVSCGYFLEEIYIIGRELVPEFQLHSMEKRGATLFEWDKEKEKKQKKKRFAFLFITFNFLSLLIHVPPFSFVLSNTFKYMQYLID